MVTRNTFLYNLAFIFLGVVFEMGSAILLNEILSKKFKKISQSIMFLPYFISWVVAGAIMYNVFNYEKGVVNGILNLIGLQPFDLYNTPKAWPFVFFCIDFSPSLETDRIWIGSLSCCDNRAGSGNV